MDQIEIIEIRQFREWILEAIDQIRHRKARPNSERICRLVQKNHPELPFQVAKVVLWKLVKTGDVLKMEYKGNTSYRNPSKMNRKYGKKKSRSTDIETLSPSDDVRYHSALNNNLKHSKRKRTRPPFCMCCFGENCTSDDTTIKPKKVMHALIEDNQKEKLIPEDSIQPTETIREALPKEQCANENHSVPQDGENVNVRTVSVCLKCNKAYCVMYSEDVNRTEYFCDHCKFVDDVPKTLKGNDNDTHIFHLQSANTSKIEETEPACFLPASEGEVLNSSKETHTDMIHPKDWTVDDVQKFIEKIGFGAEAELFRKQEVDGLSLLLMKRNDVLSNLNLRLGPALKIYQHIANLQKSSSLIKF